MIRIRITSSLLLDFVIIRWCNGKSRSLLLLFVRQRIKLNELFQNIFVVLFDLKKAERIDEYGTNDETNWRCYLRGGRC